MGTSVDDGARKLNNWLAERQIWYRKSCLVLSARFPVVNWRSRPVAKSAYLNLGDFANFRQIHQFCQNRHSSYVDPFTKTWEYLPNFGEFSANLLFAPSTVFLDIYLSNKESSDWNSNGPREFQRVSSNRLPFVDRGRTYLVNKKKLASSTELRKWIYHRFILLPCLRQRPELLIHFRSHTELLQLNFHQAATCY